MHFLFSCNSLPLRQQLHQASQLTIQEMRMWIRDVLAHKVDKTWPKIKQKNKGWSRAQLDRMTKARAWALDNLLLLPSQTWVGCHGFHHCRLRIENGMERSCTQSCPFVMLDSHVWCMTDTKMVQSDIIHFFIKKNNAVELTLHTFRVSDLTI